MKDSVKVIFALFLFLIIVTMVIFLNDRNTDKIKNDVDIYFFKTYDSDSCIIKNKDSVIMIDTALADYNAELINRMKELNITTIDYLIISHFDKDHIGNVKSIIDNFIVKKVYRSAYLKNTSLEQEVISYLNKNNIRVEIINQIDRFSLNGIKVITYPPFKEYKDYNDNSLVNAIYIGNRSLLFTGDVEKDRIKSLLKSNIGSFDIIKIPHHGVFEDNSLDLLKMVKPSYAIVTSDMLDENINNYLEKIGTKMYYTSLTEVHFITDGKAIKVDE